MQKYESNNHSMRDRRADDNMRSYLLSLRGGRGRV